MIRIDHVRIAAHDSRGSAYALASILGTEEPTLHGPDGMIRVGLDHGAFVLFTEATTVSPAHVAFHLDAATFAEAVAQLVARGIPFGNDAEHPDNGRTDDRFGGGRVCFKDQNGHLFEMTC